MSTHVRSSINATSWSYMFPGRSVFGPCFHFYALFSVPSSAVCGCGVVVVVHSHTYLLFHAQIQKCLAALTTFFFFLVDEERDDQIPYKPISGPSSACRRNAIYIAFCWRVDVGPFCSFVNFQGIRTSIAKKPFIFVIF